MSGMIRDFYDVCPDCWSVRVKHRVFKDPRYKCEKCGSEFMNKKRVSYKDRKFFNDVKNRTEKRIEEATGIGVEDAYLRKIVVKSIKELIPHA